jgi:centromere protein C
MNVEVVDRGSDDFEPFDKVMSQADARTPPRVQGRKKKQAQLSPVYDDTNGEISMDLDDSESRRSRARICVENAVALPYESPMAYYSNQRVPVAPNSVRRVGSSSRPVRHSPDTNFDDIPSPRPASRRQSKVNDKSAGPSRLSQSYVAAHDPSDIPGESGSEEDGGSRFVPAPSLPPVSPEHPSFSQLDQEEEEGEQQEVTPKASRADLSSRGGRKSVRYQEDEEEEERPRQSNKRRQSPAEEDVEEEISQALQDVDMDEAEEEQAEQQPLSDIPEEPEHEEEQLPVKKGKKGKKRESMSENAEPRPKKKPRTEKASRGRTPLADKTPEPHVVRLRSGEFLRLP